MNFNNIWIKHIRKRERRCKNEGRKEKKPNTSNNTHAIKFKKSVISYKYKDIYDFRFLKLYEVRVNTSYKNFHFL